MKFRVSFALKILLPYLLLSGLFLLIFLLGAGRDSVLIGALLLTGIVISVVMGLGHFFWFHRSLGRIASLVDQMNRGEIPDFSSSGSGDELEMLEKNLGIYLGYLASLRNFVRALASGDFSGRLEKRGAGDELGASLLLLRESLMISLKENESRHQEEEHRSWNAVGLAKFSKLFREAEDDLPVLSRILMKELVGYTEADVGALFVTVDREDGEEVLEFSGSFAYDREKHLEGNIRFWEGLVGRAAVEKSPVFISELPHDYMQIRSGLGGSLPSSLLLVPVLLDERVLGVMELASLKEMPSYQVEFVRQMGDALAVTLSKINANLRTEQAKMALKYSNSMTK